MSLSNYEKELRRLASKREKALEREITKEYKEVLDKINSEMSSVYRKYEVDGKLTYQEMTKYNRLEVLKNKVQELIDTMYKGTFKALRKGIQLEFYESYTYYSYAIEMVSKAVLKHSQLDIKIIEASVNNPISGITLSDTLNKNRQNVIYNLNRIITKGMYENQTYGTMAKNIKETLGFDYNKSINVARTEAHRVNELGKNESAKAYAEQGIIMEKTWRTMKDSRVRDRHREMEGQTVKNDEDFTGPDNEKGQCPGSMGSAKMDCNCRCRISRRIVDIQKTRNDDQKVIPYEKWKKKNTKNEKK